MGSAPDQVSSFSRESLFAQLANSRRSTSSHSATAAPQPRRAIGKTSSGELRAAVVLRMIGGGTASHRGAMEPRQCSVRAHSLRFAGRANDPAPALAPVALAGEARAIEFHQAIRTTRGFASGHPLHLFSPDRPRRVAGRVPMTRSLQHRQVRPDRWGNAGPMFVPSGGRHALQPRSPDRPLTNERDHIGRNV